MELHIEYLCKVADKPMPDKPLKSPPKRFYETAVRYFKDIESGRIERPEEFQDDDKLQECMKNSMIKWLMYEKMLTDFILQGFKPEIDESENFYVKNWTDPTNPYK